MSVHVVLIIKFTSYQTSNDQSSSNSTIINHHKLALLRSCYIDMPIGDAIHLDIGMCVVTGSLRSICGSRGAGAGAPEPPTGFLDLPSRSAHINAHAIGQGGEAAG